MTLIPGPGDGWRGRCGCVATRALGRERLALLALIALLAMAVPACDKGNERAPAAAPPPTFTGPAFLQGTVGSMTILRGIEPTYVSGYGLVMGLNGTGASDVPTNIRQWLINEMRRGGLGSARLGMSRLTPEKVLASGTTAVVLIEGFIPPGSVKGTKFDVMVTALPGTQTTSLEGGKLWTFNLSESSGGPDPRYGRPVAKASGDVYITPLEDPEDAKKNLELKRTGVVITGASALYSRHLELQLTQPSYVRSRAIADRINERFVQDPKVDRQPTAVASNDAIVKINVPARYARRPEKLMSLIGNTFIQRADNFEAEKAQQMADLLEKNQNLMATVTEVWQTLGKTALPVVRRYYDHPKLYIRLAALEAGARQGDEMALGDESTPLRILGLAKDADPIIRREAAGLMAYLPNMFRSAHALKALLDDEDRQVRIDAYETLFDSADPLLQHVAFEDGAGGLRMVLDMAPAQKPLVYATHFKVPRLVIFNSMTALKTPLLARLWDNRLMIRQDGEDQPMMVFYQPPGEIKPITNTITAPTIASLIFYLAHKPTPEHLTPGLGFSYSRVVEILHQLSQQGILPCEVEIRSSVFADQIAKARERSGIDIRPITGATIPAPPEPTPEPEVSTEPDAATPPAESMIELLK